MEILSVEERRELTNEIVLFKIYSSRLNTELTHELGINRPMRFTRYGNGTFYLPSVTTNVEYNAPLLRMQRKHDEKFSNLDLNEQNLNAFKRYAMHEIKSNQLVFDYSFS